jgi:O-antigen/teichoic acid export membrane protein
VFRTNNWLPRRWIAANLVILTNASSIIGALVVNSALGFAYWWLAAHQFPAAAVGLASAAVSAMMLLGTVGTLGLGTLMIGELPRYSSQKTSLIVTALVIAGATGGLLGLFFSLMTPFISSDLRVLADSILNMALFALGVSLTSITLVLDQGVIGLLRGDLQFWRNGIFAVAKLGMLLAAGVWLADRSGMTIYATWSLGNLISLVSLVGIAVLTGVRPGAFRLQGGLLRKLGRPALEHQALNLVLQAPNQALPIVVTVLLSTQANAYFYAAWMMAGFAFYALAAIATVLYAVGAANPNALAQKMRTTLRLSLGLSMLASVTILAAAEPVLRLFGSAYAEQAAWCLRILGLASFPLIIKYHYVALCRIRGSVAQAAGALLAGSTLELLLAAAGVRLGRLPGLSLGWLVAVCIEGIFMTLTVYRAASFHSHAGEQQTSTMSAASWKEPKVAGQGQS